MYIHPALYIRPLPYDVMTMTSLYSPTYREVIYPSHLHTLSLSIDINITYLLFNNDFNHDRVLPPAYAPLPLLLLTA